eukprot:CAMPEP_0114590436 /NCGR_PEP_ID=MMETSP0125-20121206/12701_1 /TAXON_ID=485358 ORGANISM="Aristerostoma sp., Strain ATCC 50986" /NCGR_SAMPLE_ID=MMETSP0125 /ASSEMBLY_ACC=CAM_ASM_000245 /LENGTH=141 /DNA_ID=CAMNT_0001787955 /DNA_START=39 /DNA_END=464 /DNA_ORIENTATION=-
MSQTDFLYTEEECNVCQCPESPNFNAPQVFGSMVNNTPFKPQKCTTFGGPGGSRPTMSAIEPKKNRAETVVSKPQVLVPAKRSNTFPLSAGSGILKKKENRKYDTESPTRSLRVKSERKINFVQARIKTFISEESIQYNSI